MYLSNDLNYNEHFIKMQIANFIKPSDKIKYINKLKLPLEICGIVKEFLFYDKNSLCFIKKLTTEKKELGAINKAWSRRNPPLWPFTPFENPYTEESSKWIFELPNYEWYSKKSIFTCENCPKCGEYKYIAYKLKPHVLCNYDICNC